MHAENLITLKSDRIFTDPDKFVKVSNTLVRLVALDRALGFVRSKRESTLAALQAIWKEALLKQTPREVQESSLRALSALLQTVEAIYGTPITQLNSCEGMKKALLKFQKDLKSVLVPAVQKSSVGEKGPTLLVNYQRMSPKGHINRYTFVIKWTERFELACNRIYDLFFKQANIGLQTPTASGLDFATKLFETADCKQVALGVEIVTLLFKEFLAFTPPSQKPEAKHVMVSKRIDGENLFDFAKSKYFLMNKEQKEKFFHRLGQLAMLDLIMGTIDRLVLVVAIKEDDPYSLNDAEANLGNVMVVWSQETKQPPLLYAIDNEIDVELVTSAPHKDKYKAFLQSLFKRDGWDGAVADSMVASFKSGISTRVDDAPGNVEAMRAQLKPISQDLEPIAKTAFRNGIQEMVLHLCKVLVPTWESTNQLFLKSYLKSTSPHLLEAVGERLDIFKSSVRIVS